MIQADTGPRTEMPQFASELRYTILTQWSDEDGEYVATSPEWPGLSYLSQNRLSAIAHMETLIVDAMRATQFDGEKFPTPRLAGELRLYEPKIERVLSGSEINELRTFVNRGVESPSMSQREYLEGVRDVLDSWLSTSTPADTLGAPNTQESPK